jgi:propanediol dehydratase small subunit
MRKTIDRITELLHGLDNSLIKMAAINSYIGGQNATPEIKAIAMLGSEKYYKAMAGIEIKAAAIRYRTPPKKEYQQTEDSKRLDDLVSQQKTLTGQMALRDLKERETGEKHSAQADVVRDISTQQTEDSKRLYGLESQQRKLTVQMALRDFNERETAEKLSAQIVVIRDISAQQKVTCGLLQHLSENCAKCMNGYDKLSADIVKDKNREIADAAVRQLQQDSDKAEVNSAIDGLQSRITHGMIDLYSRIKTLSDVALADVALADVALADVALADVAAEVPADIAAEVPAGVMSLPHVAPAVVQPVAQDAAADYFQSLLA